MPDKLRISCVLYFRLEKFSFKLHRIFFLEFYASILWVQMKDRL